VLFRSIFSSYTIRSINFLPNCISFKFWGHGLIVVHNYVCNCVVAVSSAPLCDSRFLDHIVGGERVMVYIINVIVAILCILANSEVFGSSVQWQLSFVSPLGDSPPIFVMTMCSPGCMACGNSSEFPTLYLLSGDCTWLYACVSICPHISAALNVGERIVLRSML
jgi:hypothetical protein